MPGRFRRGDFVALSLPAIGVVRAKVAWCSGGFFGAIFSSTVDIGNLTLGDDQDRALPSYMVHRPATLR